MRALVLCALALAGCSRTPEPSATALASSVLAAREGRPVEVHAIAEQRTSGRRIVCGHWGNPMLRPPKLASTPFLIVDGQLVEAPPAELAAAVAACRAALPTQAPPL